MNVHRIPNRRPESADPRDIADYVEIMLSERDARVTNHIDRKFEELRAYIATGFVDGDLAMHKHAHQLMVDAAKAERDFWLDMRKNLARGGIVTLLTGLGGLLLIGLRHWWPTFMGGGR